MKQMIDPKSLNFDDKYIKKDGVAADSEDIKCQTIADSSKAQIKFYSSDIQYPSGVYKWKKGPGIIVYSDSNYYNPPFISIGHALTSGSDSDIWDHMNPEPHGSNSDDQFITISHKAIKCKVGTKGDIIEFPCYYNNASKVVTATMCTNKTLKTIFGQSIYSKDGTGNIDLYAHDITITKGTGKAFLTVYSSKNTNIDSLDDLKTIAGATFTKSCTGYINSKVIVAITETSFLLADGTTEALTGATFVDTPTTI